MQGLPKIGDVLDDTYEIEELIGTGGFGAVYRARQLSMNRDVALKVLVAHAMKVEEMIQRFRREVMAVRNLGHPNTIRIYDFRDHPDGLLYYAMEYVKGPTLKDVIKETGPIPPARVHHILRQVTKSLAEAHSFGIIHRDLKPANIMLADIPGETDFVKVVDFGIAKIIGGDDEEEREQLTSAGVLVGTLNYMSPEQIAGGELGPESDLYALALIGIEMLIGKSVFAGTGRWEILHKQISDEPVDIPDAIRQTALGPVFERALRKRPPDRFQSAEAFLEALNELEALSDAPLVAPSVGERSSHAQDSAVSAERVPEPDHTPRPGKQSTLQPDSLPPSDRAILEVERVEPAASVPRVEMRADSAAGSRPETPADRTLPEPAPFEEAKTEIRDSDITDNPLDPARRSANSQPPGTPSPFTPREGVERSRSSAGTPTHAPENPTPDPTPPPAQPERTSIANEPTVPDEVLPPEQSPFGAAPPQRAAVDISGTIAPTPADAGGDSDRMLLVIAAVSVVLVLALGGVALFVFSQGGTEADEPTADQPPVTAPEIAANVDQEDPEEPAVDELELADPSEEIETPPEPEEPAVESRVIRLVTPGVKAQVYEGTELLGDTPLRFPVGEATVYTLTAENHEDATVELSNESDAEVEVKMKRLSTGRPKTSTKTTKTKTKSKSDDGWLDVPTGKKSPKKTPKAKEKDDGPSIPVF